MWLNQSGDGFEVMDVIPGGPAATAGIKIGDRVLTIDSHPVRQFSLPAVRQEFKSQQPGTKLRLSIQSGEQKRDVNLVLKDLV